MAKRRAAAIKSLLPIINETQRMQRIAGKANNRHPDFTALTSDKLYMLALRGLEEPCDWTQSETWDAMNIDENA